MKTNAAGLSIDSLPQHPSSIDGAARAIALNAESTDVGSAGSSQLRIFACGSFTKASEPHHAPICCTSDHEPRRGCGDVKTRLAASQPGLAI
jgi:hypothetical protein